MSGSLHALTDLLSALIGAAAGWMLYFYRLKPAGIIAVAQQAQVYWLVLVCGALIGAFWFGTVNLYVTGIPGIGRSMFGAIFGGVFGIEIYKRRMGISGSTGALFVLPLSLGMVFGRVGCFLAGLGDFTYGLPTTLPWGRDFGDGVPRHPVQLYESLAMAVFAGAFLVWAQHRPQAAARQGFYIFIAYYCAQRFLWEFFKPYGEVAGILTVFQIGAVLLFGYAGVMLHKVRTHHARA